MPASEAARASYQHDHCPRTYGTLQSCAQIRSEILAKLSDLYYNFSKELSPNQRAYIRNVGTPWTECVHEALERNKPLAYYHLTDGLKIIERLNHIYTSIEHRLYDELVRNLRHPAYCVCSYCWVESEAEEL